MNEHIEALEVTFFVDQTCSQVPYPVEKVVEKVVHIPKPYPVIKHVPVEVKVPGNMSSPISVTVTNVCCKQ